MSSEILLGSMNAARTGDQPARGVVLHARVVTGTGGGPEKTILNSPRFLADYGYRAICAYMHPPGDPGIDVLRTLGKAAGAQLISVPDRGPLDTRLYRQLLNVCRDHRVTVWHGHDYKSNLLGIVLRRSWSMRLVTTVHGWVKHTRRTPIYYWIDRQCLKHYERVICVSQDLFDACCQAGVPRHRCVLIENAIDTDRYARQLSTVEAKKRLQVRENRLLVGAIGRLSSEKGFDVLIQAVGKLIGDGLDVELVILGEGDDRPRLERMIRRQPCSERFRLVGYCADPIPWYQAMDLFVLSSLREGLPNVLLEAMALEVPVVATRVAGVPRLIQDGQNGILCSPGDPDGLARAMRHLLGDQAHRQALAAAARTTIEQSYSFARRMEKIRAVYAELGS